MKYKYLITDISDGCVYGTDDESLAKDYAQSEDFFVADVTRGVSFLSDGGETDITPARDYRNEQDQ
jgi:hypothetical protein